MGAISPCPNYTPDLAKTCMDTIFLPTVKALNAEGRTFQGVIYFGMMLTPNGPKVVEYNARFGDPECQAVLSLLETDLMDILEACVDGTLDQVDVKFKDAASCCLVLASGGYPVAYEKGKEITGLDHVKDAVVFHAGTKKQDGKFLTNGGRVLGVTAVAPTLREAVVKAYAKFSSISLLFCKDFIQLVHKAVDVLKLPVNRRKPHIAHLIQRFEPLHHQLANVVAFNLPLQRVLHHLLDF